MKPRNGQEDACAEAQALAVVLCPQCGVRPSRTRADIRCLCSLWRWPKEAEFPERRRFLEWRWEEVPL